MSTDTSGQPKSSSGPSIIQVVIWGFVAGAFGTLFAFIGTLLSDTPKLPPPADTLHGASSPAQMNRIVDTLLANAQTALDHDTGLVSKLVLAIIALSAVSVATSVYVVIRRRQPQRAPAPAWRTVLLILLLAVVPAAVSITVCATTDRLFQSAGASQAMSNENTRPAVAARGKMVTVKMPITLQSFFGYHECKSFDLKYATATLPSGEQLPIKLGEAKFDDGGRKPGKTDLIPLMENVTLRLDVVVPDDPQLCGAIIDLGVTGSLRLIPSNSKEPIASGDFDTTATFRVARDQEAQFQASYDALSSRITGLLWYSIPSSVFAVLALVFFSPWFCRKCRQRVNPFKIMDGHICRKCHDEQEAKKKEKTAEEGKTPQEVGAGSDGAAAQ